jgi:SIR2-like domain
VICPHDLRRRYHEGRVIPFIGAGASMSVRWMADDEERRGPSWPELVDQAAKWLGFDSPELARARGTDLQILEYFKLKHSHQIAKLTNWLARSMIPPDEALQQSSIHRELAALGECRIFYTTNYDNFIERAFELHGRRAETVVLESQMGGPRRECEVIKFHGDLDHPDQIVLTESDYERRLSLSTALDQRLRGDLLGRVILFIGYSFRDPNVSYLFRLFTDDFYDRAGSLPGNRAYIVVRDPSDFEEELFGARRIEVIGVDGGNIAAQTATLLREMRS